MNHLKTGNSYFGAGSYVKYKFNGVELQETGLYAMDWRNYQADVARFSGVDALSESYDSFSPYHFAMNNPVSYSDPSGMYSTDHNGNYSTTNTAEISELQRYFGGGGSVDGVGSFISENDIFKKDVQEVIINVNGKGNKETWNLGGNYLFNSYTLYNGILKGLNNWNFQTKAGAMSESLVGVRNDQGIMMIGGYGDPLGLFDIGGLIINTWEPRNRYLAMAVGVVGAVALKKPGLATSEIKAEGKIIGLGIDKDLTLHRGTGAIIYEYGAWQKAGLTTVDWAKASLDKFHFRSSFKEAAENATAIRFEVTNFNPFYHKPGITNFEFDHVLSTPGLLQKTTFIKAGNKVIWNGAQFINKY